MGSPASTEGVKIIQLEQQSSNSYTAHVLENPWLKPLSVETVYLPCTDPNSSMITAAFSTS